MVQVIACQNTYILPVLSPNYAFKPIAEQALRPNQTIVPQRLNAALGFVMKPSEDTLHIAEIMYPSGEIRERYARRLSEDGQRWIREGMYVSYHENGAISSETTFNNGAEHGLCREYYENGQLAASGEYKHGREHGLWEFWNPSGDKEQSVEYADGKEVEK